MTEPLAFLNGRLLPQSQTTLALHDAGFVFGATVTDLCRTFRHQLFRWPNHLQRFRQSCESAYLEVAATDDEITGRAIELIEHNAKLIDSTGDLAIVLFATPGPVGYYTGQSLNTGEPTFGMHTFPLPFGRYRPWIEQGVVLATPSVRAVPAASIDPHIKQRSRMHWWLAEQEVRRAKPGAQALLLDLDGHVTETASANFLLVRDGAIVSPRRANILEGISLGVVAELSGRLGIPLAYKDISLDDCHAADEAILTCTSFCLAGVREINGRKVPWPGPITRRLLETWSADVGVEIHEQILNAR